MSVKRDQKMGGGGNCISPKCGYKALHDRSVPCKKVQCPDYSAKLLREGSYHHELLLQKKERINKS